MIRNAVLILLLFTGISFYAQAINFDPDSILVGDRRQPTVLLVGTFHFAYYNQDVYKTASENQIDILSVKKRQEVKELLEYLHKFRPTKVVVEDFNENNILMKKYRMYKSGKRN